MTAKAATGSSRYCFQAAAAALAVHLGLDALHGLHPPAGFQ